MNKLVVLLVAFALAGIAIPAAAKPVAKCDATESEPTAEFDDTYVVVDLTGAYVYQESNAIPGLQRDDAGADNTCDGILEADTQVL